MVMRAFAVDLYERVVVAVDAGVPHLEVARLFRVSSATIKCYLKRRERGGLVPGCQPGISLA